MDEAKFRTLITTFTNELRHELQRPPMSSDENDPFEILNLYNTYAESLGWDIPTPVRVYFITAFYSTAKLILPLLPVLKPPSPDETCSDLGSNSSFNLNFSPEISVRDTLVPLVDPSSPDSSVEFEETVLETPTNSPNEPPFESYSILPSLPLQGCSFEQNEPVSLETPTDKFSNVIEIPLCFNKGNTVPIESKIKQNQASILIDTGATLSHISKGYYVSTRKDTVEGHYDPVVYFGPFPLLIYKIVFFYSHRLPLCRKLSLLDVSTMLFSTRSCSVII